MDLILTFTFLVVNDIVEWVAIPRTQEQISFVFAQAYLVQE